MERGMPRLFKDDLLRLSDRWMLDARSLFRNDSLEAAYHAGGIALECALKARIASFTHAQEFPDKRRAEQAWKHDPTQLLVAASLSDNLRAEGAVRKNWTMVKDWSVDSRYEHSMTRAKVEDFLNALDTRPDGILPWLRKHC
jgi:hypothetical protein